MLKKTKERYIRLFEYHTKSLEKINLKTLTGRLNELAKQKPGDSWRELRNAFSVAVAHKYGKKGAEASKTLRAMQNPIAVKDRPKKPNNRIKSISQTDIDKLLDTARDKKDRVSEAIITIMRLTGCRPAEAQLIVVEPDRIFIPSAKKGEQRGLDRFIKLPQREARIIRDRVNVLTDALKGSKDPESLMRKRFSRLAKATFPRRKHLPCLYTLRHEYGANLKASGRDRFEIAYLMGHQATASVERYGGRRRANGSPISTDPAVTKEQIREQVRDTINDQFLDQKNQFNSELNKGEEITPIKEWDNTPTL